MGAKFAVRSVPRSPLAAADGVVVFFLVSGP